VKRDVATVAELSLDDRQAPATLERGGRRQHRLFFALLPDAAVRIRSRMPLPPEANFDVTGRWILLRSTT